MQAALAGTGTREKPGPVVTVAPLYGKLVAPPASEEAALGLLLSVSLFLGFLFTGSPLSLRWPKRDETLAALLLDWMRLASSPSL